MGFAVLLIVEIGIALYIHDTIIRPFIGDMLVVILIYCFVMALLLRVAPQVKAHFVAFGVLIFAFCIEGLQATPILEWLHLSQHHWATIVLGNTFDWRDLVAYIAGILLILILEERAQKT